VSVICLHHTRLAQYLQCSQQPRRFYAHSKDEEIGSKRLSNLPEVTKLMSGKQEFEPNPV
jgi:hypothetical protein